MRRFLPTFAACLALVAAACDVPAGPVTVLQSGYVVLDARAFHPGISSAPTQDYCYVRTTLPLREIPAEWSGAADVLVVRMRRSDGQLRTVVERIEPGVPVRLHRVGEAVSVVLGGSAADSVSGVGAATHATGSWTCPATYPGGVAGEPLPTGTWRLGPPLNEG